ncbi:MAG: LamG domain-containing protein [Propionicimonas sp.]
MTPRWNLALVSTASLALLFTPCVPATAESLSGSDSRPVSSRVFASNSPFYQRLPTRTPAASNSKKLVKSLNSQAHKFYGTRTKANVAINTNRFTPALYVAHNADPVHDITGWNCQHKADGWDTELNRQLAGLHLPADMKPDPSTDGSISVYNSDTRELIELWKARLVDGAWQACWGGKIPDADEAAASFPYGYGASASGLALWGGIIRQSELLDGRIDHAINLAIPYTKRGTISWPANRTDGNSPGTQLAIGQKLRLPANLNLSAMKLSPVALTIATAAQRYGIIVTETSGSVAFSAENPIGLASDQYNSIFRGRWAYLEMLGNPKKGEVAFPLNKLVALPLDYQVPPTTSTVTPNRTYAAAVKAARPAINWRLNDTGSVAADASGNKRLGTLVGVARYVRGAIPGNTAIQTNGDPSSGVYQTKASKPARKFSVQVWFKTTTTDGGKLVGFENTRTWSGSRADRSLYMTNEGKVLFGTINRSIRTVVSAEAYNDGAWHQATATQGSNGTRLYVDGSLVARSTVAGAQGGSGYWRLGGGNLRGWPDRPTSSYFAGSLDEFAYYGSALSATTIAGQYRAAG